MTTRILKTVSYLIFMTVITLNWYVYADDILVVIPDMPPTNEEHKQLENLFSEVNKGLPYSKDSTKQFSTLGVLCKGCELIFLGEVTRTERSNKNNVTNPTSETDFDKIDIKVLRLLSGNYNPEKLTIQERWLTISNEVKLGGHVIVFLTTNNMYYKTSWNWHDNATSKKIFNLEKAIVPGNNRGLIFCIDEAEEKQYINAVTRYLSNLRQGKKDTEAYYNLLRQLMQSENNRIKNDAICDLLFFIRSYNDFDLSRIIDDPKMDEGLKKYASLLIKTSEAKQEAEQ